MPTIKVTQAVYKALVELQGQLQATTGRRYSFNDVIMEMLKGRVTFETKIYLPRYDSKTG